MSRILTLTVVLIAALAAQSSAGERDPAPYIGPFYPYPQVPLGWREVQKDLDDDGYRPQFYIGSVDVNRDGIVNQDDYVVWQDHLRNARYLGDFESALYYAMDVDGDAIADFVAFAETKDGPVMYIILL